MNFEAGNWREGLRGWVAQAGAVAESAVNEERIRLAVTGLSRAGKTVFITSLVHNLLALGGGRNTLPRLAARLAETGGNRLLGVSVLPSGAAVLPHFDYAANLAHLAAESPSWPQRTEDMAQVSLGLELRRKSAVGQRLGSRRVRLDVLDYPGEWLLDLPLLDQSFADWSAQTLTLLRAPPRREAGAAFLYFLSNLRPSDRADESVARQGHDLYRAALQACRRQHGLRYLQPGRFLCPGPRSEAPFLWFFPLEGAPSASVAPGTFAELLRERFEAYKRDMRASFFDTHFAAFDRQVMLVDVLGALYAGQAAFDDTARAIQDVAQALRYGVNRSGLLQGVAAGALRGTSYLLPAAGRLGSRRIERVAFVATKADHVPALQRDNLRNLLRALAQPAETRQSGLGAAVTYRTAAALLSTEDGVGNMGGRPVEVVRGIQLGEDKVRPFYVGEVPSSVPPESFWRQKFLEIPQFRPPPLTPDGRHGLPHLGLDLILDDLIGDLL